MAQKDREIQERYCRLLREYVQVPGEEVLEAARSLGRDLGRRRIPQEALGRLHREALQRLVEKTPRRVLKEALVRAADPLAEAWKGYGAPLREEGAERERAAAVLREADYHLRCILRKKALETLH